MQTQTLNGTWNIKKLDSNEQFSATVPGSVYQTLLAHNFISDPFFKDNEKDALPLMDSEYEFTTTFVPSKELQNSQKIELIFEGIDTLATISMNGVTLGTTNNMHRTWKYDVAKYLQSESNELSVIFHSPTKYIQTENEALECLGASECMTGFPHLRKAHYMFGWDWGPHLPDAGIWRSVYLTGSNSATIDNFYVTQTHTKKYVQLDLALEETLLDACVPSYEIEVTTPNGDSIKYNTTTIEITNPQLWWPNGLGEQPLYQITVTQFVDGIITDTCSKKIGLRTLTMNTEKDEFGNAFSHCINGIHVFAMGADYVPEDNLIGRVSYETTYVLLKQCVTANFNSIRVWGGGYYPDDFFFDICDELGLLVWQDFMFACAVYELTPEFEQNIRIEVTENIKRIRHHACLALWCGNNEMELFVNENTWVSRPSQKADYIKMYEYIIPNILREYDPNTFYWPASPSSGGSFDEPNDDNRGDVHYWSVWHGNEPFTKYRSYYFRYLSEFGFQSFPSRKTIETFTDDPDDMNPFSYIMEKHQRCFGGNGKIIKYMQQMYLYPTSFKQMVYASQLLQADAIKYGVEHFRQNRGRCMGAIYWQLNDCWPVTSWSSIDYCGRWKALHYYAKRFFAPVMISCKEEGMLTQSSDLNDTNFSIKPSAQLNVTNETHNDRTFLVKYTLQTTEDTVLLCDTKEVTVPAFSSIWLDPLSFEHIDLFHTYFYFELYDEKDLNCEHALSSGSVIFSLPKYFHYKDPKLSYKVNGTEITITADCYAKSVEILNENEDLILSDNYFDMNAGSKTVEIISGDASKLTLNSVFDIG